MMRTALLLGASALTLALAGCAGDSDGDGDGSEDSGPTERATLVPNTTAPPAASDASADTTAPAERSTTTSVASTSTTTLTPAPGADLPDSPPDQDPGPPTTAPGPLPEPTVSLAEFGQFSNPVDLAVRPGDPRLFVIEQGGRVLAADDLSEQTVLDISDRVTFEGERGLLGLAFHPDLDLAYVDYTDAVGDTVVEEYAIDPVTAVFDPDSARTVLTIEQPYANHNGGDLVFGPDGYLYVATGDGGSGGDPERRALDLSSRLGKVLRVDPVGSVDEPFLVPDGNPFVDVAGADPTIWAFGLRNPWRISFDPLTGDLWIADVGQGDWEEVNRAGATEGRLAGRGGNFGWSAFEGLARFNEDQPADGSALDGTAAPLIPPVLVYGHDDGDCSVSGGVVYRGEVVPGLDGWYVAGDYCSGRIFAIDTTSVGSGEPARTIDLATQPSLAAISEAPDGELYAISTDGTISRFIAG